MAVVANCSMNRERGLSGVNSYSRELNLDLKERLSSEVSSWLDLCCGEGRALKEAAFIGTAVLVGVDLLPTSSHAGVSFVVSPLLDYQAPHGFDLITCVHGLHYLGDKLAALQMLSGWLNPGGQVLAHFDPQSIKTHKGKSLSRVVLNVLQESGYEYSKSKRLIRGFGPLSFPFKYLGCDPKAGPNYTGQPAVDSYYEKL